MAVTDDVVDAPLLLDALVLLRRVLLVALVLQIQITCHSGTAGIAVAVRGTVCPSRGDHIGAAVGTGTAARGAAGSSRGAYGDYAVQAYLRCSACRPIRYRKA